jgi:signal transduction histidine kinase
MTIKRRLFLSNILMIAVPVALFVVFNAAMSVIMSKWFQGWDGDSEELLLLAGETEYLPPLLGIGAGMMAVMAGIIFATNLALTRMALKSVTAPLDTLSYGVRQVHDGNLSFRLDYLGKDEFSPICDSFNQMAERLERLERDRASGEESRKELIAGISHDLRTPLTAIKAYLEGLEKGVARGPEQQRKYLGIIKSKSEDLERIIEQLLLFSNLETKAYPVRAKPEGIGEAVLGIARELADEYASKGLIISAEIEGGLVANADIQLLRNAIVNILENSAKYKNKEEGRALVSVQGENGGILIRISDDGPGVAPEELEKLFNMFHRSDPSRGTRGNGLGLAISAKTIELMGGRISAELADGGGLAILLRLPQLEERL